MIRKQTSYYATKSEIDRDWVLIDAKDKILGRLATMVSMILRGKDTPQFTPSMATGRNVVIINAEKIQVTGNKVTDKKYYSASGYPGGLKERSYEEVMAKDPTKILRKAIQGMLPDNRLKAVFMRSLKIYVGDSHPHAAQNLKKIEIVGG
jgi:large subunit ribosomal protein L13